MGSPIYREIGETKPGKGRMKEGELFAVLMKGTGSALESGQN